MLEPANGIHSAYMRKIFIQTLEKFSLLQHQSDTVDTCCQRHLIFILCILLTHVELKENFSKLISVQKFPFKINPEKCSFVLTVWAQFLLLRRNTGFLFCLSGKSGKEKHQGQQVFKPKKWGRAGKERKRNSDCGIIAKFLWGGTSLSMKVYLMSVLAQQALTVQTNAQQAF